MKKYLEGINAIIMLLMFVVIVFTVFNRQVLDASSGWSVEFSQFCFISLIFIGSAACMEDESHLNITLLVDRLSEGTQKIVRIIGRIFMIFFLVIFVIGSYDNMVFNWNVELVTVRWIKVGYIYLIMLISGITMIFYLFKNIYYDVFNRKPLLPDLGGDEPQCQ